MPSKDVLADAVSKGIIAPEQADALLELENKPVQHPELARKAELDAEDDEGFRFISGFNDIFLAFGVSWCFTGYLFRNWMQALPDTPLRHSFFGVLVKFLPAG